ncbi:hypothetical protein EGW08_013496, partial [Elysia chlorotica]
EELLIWQNNCDSDDDAVVSFLLAIVKIIKKGKDLELVQKSARDDAQECLQNTEHRVTEVVNDRMVTALRKKIDDIATQNNEDSFGIFVPKEFPPRQLVKVVDQGWAGWNDCSQLLLVHFGKKAVTLAQVSRKSSANVKSYKEMTRKLQQLVQTKSKHVQVAGGEIDVFLYTMNNRCKGGSPLDETFWHDNIPLTWFQAS